MSEASLLPALGATSQGQLLSQALNLSGAFGCLCLGFLYCLWAHLRLSLNRSSLTVWLYLMESSGFPLVK